MSIQPKQIKSFEDVLKQVQNQKQIRSNIKIVKKEKHGTNLRKIALYQ